MNKAGSVLRTKTGSRAKVWVRGKVNSSLARKFKHVEIAVQLIHELFIVLLTTSILLLLLETIWTESVTAYLNINYFFIAAIMSGVIVILSRPQEREEDEKSLTDSKSIMILSLAGVVVSVIIYFKIRDIGFLSYFISLISGLMTMLMLLIVWREGHEREDS